MGNGHLAPATYFLSGNDACTEGAIIAGCNFFAGYPITPANEISERMSKRMPQTGGIFLQMEDEMGSIGAIIGASWAGAKAMTATSGPGFSLMQEHIGFAIATETPCVLVDVQRGAPGTGIVALPMQGDVFQARWGHHGGCELIALAPSTVQEMLECTITAFNFAEEYRTPVVVLSDAFLGHLREKVIVPPISEIEIKSRKKCAGRIEECRPFLADEGVAPIPLFGEGYHVLVCSTSHDEWGQIKTTPDNHFNLVQKLNNKILKNVDKMTIVETSFLYDAEVVVISYGVVARSALKAVNIARTEGIKAGYVRLGTLWPFNDRYIGKLLEDAKSLVVVELNAGQMIREIQRVFGGERKISHISGICRIVSPLEIYAKIKESYR